MPSALGIKHPVDAQRRLAIVSELAVARYVLSLNRSKLWALTEENRELRDGADALRAQAEQATRRRHQLS
jgi:hypothetical protein